MDSLKKKIFEKFDKGAELCRWLELLKNYELLEQRQTRPLSGPGAGRLMLQCNPARIGSTLAKVNCKSIKARTCFLCAENLPAKQRGVLYRGEYLLLCNPYPIFEKHFTIACIAHKPQNITGTLPDFLRLAADLEPQFTVFYNGPQCGASAPDHLHFQAYPTGQLPIDMDMDVIENNPPVLKTDEWEVRVAEITGRGVILVKANDIAPATHASLKMLSALSRAGSAAAEPLLNIIARKENGVFKIGIFPRRKFRPDCFYLEGEQRIAVSPAAVELGGLIITPFKKNYDLLDFEGTVSILKEVSKDAASILKMLSL